MIKYGNSKLYIVNKLLYIEGKSEVYDALEGEGDPKRCRLTNENAKVIRKFFPFTNPVSHKGRPFTIGLGDRLGLASPGHIRCIKDLDVFPVLAQQSMRELGLTNRTYDDVLSAGVWAVFQEGYKKGYGADGDHLKTHEEVKYALEVGFSMITLDCSSHIGKGIYENLEEEYLNKDIDGLIYTSDNIKNIINIYYGAVKHAIDIYNSFIRGTNIDFEMSIDETSFTTSPEAHYFIANELKKAGVELISLAPKFCGEFQKGIDYRGDLKQFEDEFKIHAKIAKMMGYKLSIHSGSDKLAVYPIIYKETGRNVHIKTAGTNWLEALRVIAQKNPSLFREIFKTALVNLAEAKKLYHITENAANIPTIIDSNLLDHDDARQVLHITYGAVLAAHKNEIYATLNEFEEDYYKNLKIHLDKHLFV